jgi:hypothetical protein
MRFEDSVTLVRRAEFERKPRVLLTNARPNWFKTTTGSVRPRPEALVFHDFAVE